MADKRFSMAGILFCMVCGSSRVDILYWKGFRARLRCFHCGNEGELEGFTTGRCYSVAQDAAIEAYQDRGLPKFCKAT